MAKRPALTEDSFLKHLFSPKKNALPTGIRKRPIVSSKGRSKSRVAAYNRMSAQSQELLRRSGQRDAYLRGDASLKDARAILRETAVGKGIAKPVRRAGKPAPIVGTTLDGIIANHVIRELKDAGYTPHRANIYDRSQHLPDDIKPDVVKWKVGQIRAYAGDGTNVVIVDGESFNPLWYK
jgi:hypothetical protein